MGALGAPRHTRRLLPGVCLGCRVVEASDLPAFGQLLHRLYHVGNNGCFVCGGEGRRRSRPDRKRAGGVPPAHPGVAQSPKQFTERDGDRGGLGAGGKASCPRNHDSRPAWTAGPSSPPTPVPDTKHRAEGARQANSVRSYLPGGAGNAGLVLRAWCASLIRRRVSSLWCVPR
jgi:hypothetical protein